MGQGKAGQGWRAVFRVQRTELGAVEPTPCQPGPEPLAWCFSPSGVFPPGSIHGAVSSRQGRQPSLPSAPPAWQDPSPGEGTAAGSQVLGPHHSADRHLLLPQGWTGAQGAPSAPPGKVPELNPAFAASRPECRLPFSPALLGEDKGAAGRVGGHGGSAQGAHWAGGRAARRLEGPEIMCPQEVLGGLPHGSHV